jgi:hypothetical protein
MRRKILSFGLFAFLTVASGVTAQTNNSDNVSGENEAAMKRFGISWGLSFMIQPDVFQRTSSMGINFQVFDNEKLHIRNHII